MQKRASLKAFFSLLNSSEVYKYRLLAEPATSNRCVLITRNSFKIFFRVENFFGSKGSFLFPFLPFFGMRLFDRDGSILEFELNRL